MTENLHPSRLRTFGWLWLLSLAIFWPVFDNGFISDDFVLLERVETWLSDPFYLFSIPPENFRSTTYLAILLLKKTTGTQAWMFYLFTISLHAVNAFLLDRLLLRITGQGSISFVAALLFVSFQNPQEALMWVSGMNELLLGFFSLSCLLFWARGRTIWSLTFYCGALFSKESAIILLFLIAVVEVWQKGRLPLHFSYFAFLLPTLPFAGLFWWTLGSNSLVRGEYYEPGLHALKVWLRSLHGLAFPWLYGVVAASWLRHCRPALRVWPAVLWAAAALLPYVFLTYQSSVPSRHEYLASLGLAMLLAIPLHGCADRPFRRAFVAVFVLFNGAYILLVKDPQFEERAAPTTQLIEELERRRPGPVRIVDFPYNPWVARLTTRLVEGWAPQQIAPVSEEPCPGCDILRWDRRRQKYVSESAGQTNR